MKFTRRRLLQTAPAAVASPLAAQPLIDRRAVVTRHNPVMRAFNPLSPLSVGNGEFAFTADATGLQTFPELYENQMPLCTQSQWGWHSFSNRPDGEMKLEPFDTYGRSVGYLTRPGDQRELFNWLRENPHRLHLGRIGLTVSQAAEVSAIEQTLDLWQGRLISRFRVRDVPVTVETCCHPELDAIAVVIRTRLLEAGDFGAIFDFPYGSPQMNAADWDRPDRHSTATVGEATPGRADLVRKLDDDTYSVAVGWQTHAAFTRTGPHRFTLLGAKGSQELAFVCRFTPAFQESKLPNAAAIFDAAFAYWEHFWSTGAAMSLEGPRGAAELERRVVLSQYLTAIQCSGSMPPQETGLTCNSWYGKFHLEMHWWHAAHFALWGRAPLLERSLAWYDAILPSARQKARDQGYAGARWPKMVGPEGRDSPSAIGTLLIWQQPHPIAYAEMCRRVHPDRRTLERYREVVFATADFMASYAHWEENSRFVLGPPVIPAQENHPPRQTWNPTFELEYWHYGLGVALRWRELLGLPPEPKWEEVRAKLSALPVKDGIYLAHENCPQTFTERNRDHPSMLGALGVLPGAKVESETMRRTLYKVFAEWKWADTWGWDFPMVAMTAARLGERKLAMQALLMETPKNTWLPNGHNWQRPNLPLYLPGNGGLLAAAAMMATRKAFPAEWTVRHEGLLALL